jgi:hypothetical protein
VTTIYVLMTPAYSNVQCIDIVWAVYAEDFELPPIPIILPYFLMDLRVFLSNNMVSSKLTC